MQNRVICIGSALTDELLHLSDELLPATTNDATATKTPGGVSRNIAEQLSIFGIPVSLITVFGNDSEGDWLKKNCHETGIDIHPSITINGQTGKYTGIIHADGSLHAAFFTNGSIDKITPAHLENQRSILLNASYIVADGSISREALKWLIEFSKETGTKMILEPLSVPAVRKFRNINLSGLYLITPNEDELPAITDTADYNTAILNLLNQGIAHVWLRQGAGGSTFYSPGYAYHLQAPCIEMMDCTGAGDGSLCGYILGQYLNWPLEKTIQLSHTLSAEILQVRGAIIKHLTLEQLIDKINQYYPS